MKNNVWLCLALLACAAPFSSKATDAGPFGPAATDNCNTGAVSVPNTLLARREAGSEAVFPNAQELVVCAAPTVSASGPVLFCPGSSIILSSSA